jgi:hypothetical protein
LSVPQKECQKKSQNSPSSVPKQGKIVPKKKVHIPSHPLFPALIPSFTISPPSFGNFMSNRKQGAKSGQGMGQGMGLGRTLQITLLIQMTVIYN